MKTEDSVQRVRKTADAIYRSESRRIFATLVRLLGDFDLAEEALHDAFRAALEQWPRAGVPERRSHAAQRIVRAKAKIRDARIPYQVPTPDQLPQRLDSVLRVVYLVFNEGYSASSGVERVLASRRFGPYTIQAAIAAVHANAVSADATDWDEIVGLYDVLQRTDRSPVVELNRAVAVAMRDGPAAGLALIDAIFAVASTIPPARVGSIEVRPIRELAP